MMKKTGLGIILLLLLVGGVVALYKTVTGISTTDADIALPPALLGDSIELGDKDEIDLADIVAVIEEEETEQAEDADNDTDSIIDTANDPNIGDTDLADNDDEEAVEAPESQTEPESDPTPEPVAPEPTPTPVENEDTQDVNAQVAVEGGVEQDLGAILGELLGDLDAELEPSDKQEQQEETQVDPEPTPAPEPQAEPEPVAQAPVQNFPVYSDYNPATVQAAAAAGKTTVLFFHADWCPTCVALESSILDNMSDLNTDLAVFKTDFDNTTLSEAYGVSKQHTLLSFDASGGVANSSRSIFSYQQLNALVQ